MGDGHAKDPWLKLAWSVWGITSLSLTTVLTTLIRTMHKGGIWSQGNSITVAGGLINNTETVRLLIENDWIECATNANCDNEPTQCFWK